MNKKYILFTLIGAAFLVSCGKQIPKGVIKPDKMENILYDYHLSDAMSGISPYEESYKNKAYKEFIFKKYKITQADFDSSLVWYTKNPKELAKIYTDIGEKMRNQDMKIKNILSSKSNKKSGTLSGDVVDIWNDNNLFWLTSSPLSNKFSFQIVADTTYRKNDRFVFTADYTFLSLGKQDAVMGINVVFDNDSITGATRVVKRNGISSISIVAGGERGVRSVNGFIFYKGANSSLGVLANNIKLKRYHNAVVDNVLSNEVDTASLSQMQSVPVNNTILNSVDTKVTVDTVSVPIQNEVPVIDKAEEVREKLRLRKK